MASASQPLSFNEENAALSPTRCVVLVPVADHVEKECEIGLRELEQRGYAVWRVFGFSAIDQARNQIATNALDAGFRELMWIDSDVAFHPDTVETLRRHGLPFVAGIYPRKGHRLFACNFLPYTTEVRMGKHGGIMEAARVGMGFTLCRREVFERIQTTEQLPVCNEIYHERMIPFFQPLVVPDERGHSYLPEDFAFCERVRRAGFPICIDTSIRLWHIGLYGYGWEDAGRDPDRFGDYTYTLWKREADGK